MSIFERLADALYVFRYGWPEPSEAPLDEAEPEQAEPQTWFASSCNLRQPPRPHPAVEQARQQQHDRLAGLLVTDWDGRALREARELKFQD